MATNLKIYSVNLVDAAVGRSQLCDNMETFSNTPRLDCAHLSELSPCSWTVSSVLANDIILFQSSTCMLSIVYEQIALMQFKICDELVCQMWRLYTAVADNASFDICLLFNRHLLIFFGGPSNSLCYLSHFKNLD